MRKCYLQFGMTALLLCFAAREAMAEGPKAQLKGTMEHVLEVLRTIRSAEDITKNKDRLRQILLTRFDFAEMARKSLGSHWENLNGKEAEFIAAFTSFIEKSYLGRLGSYRGEKILYGHERVDENLAEVETRVVGGQGAEIDLRYRLHLAAGEWKVYDVVIDQVSLVSNYRSQFSRVLRTASLEELLAKLREKGALPQSR
jgi:phospholipid transport system substrate-binding protein